MRWYETHISAVSKSAVVTSTARPVASRSRRAPRMPVTAHMPVPMSTIDVPTRAGSAPE